jgi:hypothetical protein
VVPIGDGTQGLSANYLKVALAKRRQIGRIEDVIIGNLTSEGVSETGALAVIV